MKIYKIILISSHTHGAVLLTVACKGRILGCGVSSADARGLCAGHVSVWHCPQRPPGRVSADTRQPPASAHPLRGALLRRMPLAPPALLLLCLIAGDDSEKSPPPPRPAFIFADRAGRGLGPHLWVLGAWVLKGLGHPQAFKGFFWGWGGG